MAVGRLPRNQRRIGGAATINPPPATSAAVTVEYPTVMWQATLRQPAGVVGAGGTIAIAVDVVGNVNLTDVTAAIRLEPHRGKPHPWLPAIWATTDGNRGTCVAHHTNAQPGRYHVTVRPTVGRQAPHLPAGRIHVQ